MAYVHGYDAREATRLADQAGTLEELLHHDTGYPQGSRVLEAGCGVGAQTIALATRSPGARIVAVDISPESVAAARARVEAADTGAAVEFAVADLHALPFAPRSFDHLFLCFVLEHLREPERALRELAGCVVAGGTVTVIEGDHGSTFLHPDSAAALAAVDCQVQLQARAGGDANIGRRLYPLLSAAGLQGVHVSPRFVYADESRPGLADGFTLRTFTAMIEGVREPALAAGLSTPEAFDVGVRDLRRAAGPGGTFAYTFFKATARVA
jgi:SAM-dependent methyltransferase